MSSTEKPIKMSSDEALRELAELGQDMGGYDMSAEDLEKLPDCETPECYSKVRPGKPCKGCGCIGREVSLDSEDVATDSDETPTDPAPRRIAHPTDFTLGDMFADLDYGPSVSGYQIPVDHDINWDDVEEWLRGATDDEITLAIKVWWGISEDYYALHSRGLDEQYRRYSERKQQGNNG